jgi:hypothetical protein
VRIERVGAVVCVVALGVWGGLAEAAAPPPPPRPHAEGPPPGHTGGFGEPTCQACHTEYALDLPGGRLEIEGVPAAWEPGRTYLLTVVLHSEDMGAAGFQLTTRGPDGRPAGSLAPVDARVAVDSVPGDTLMSGVFARHTRTGTRIDDPSSARWVLAWTAPPVATPVHFHGAANSANGDDSPFGDLIYTVNFSTAPADTLR